ncbi:MAG: flagellar motor switch protein FliN [Candidatus Zixiibacteriota bacterium]|nr:MAG: flagellar motor switch protein FliN [candidate division Zixibacteria bacterium]
MTEEELNKADSENNGPPQDVPGEEASANQRNSAGADRESTPDNISDPTMDESSSLAKDEAHDNVKEGAAESEEQSGESSNDDSGELSQEEIDKAFEAVNGSGDESRGINTDQAEVHQNQDEEAADGNIPAAQPGSGAASQDQHLDSEFNVVRSKDLEDFGKPEPGKHGQKIEMLLDVTLPISIELGRTSMPIQDILNLGPGSVVELNRLAGEPVDLLVNDKLIARGEVVVVDENFGVRVTTMVSQKERLKSLM